MKRVIVFSLIGGLVFAVEGAMGLISLPYKTQPREPKRYAVEYYVPVIRVQPEVEHRPNQGPYARFITVLEGYKISDKPQVEIKMDNVKNIYYIPRIRSGWFPIGIGLPIYGDRVRGWEVKQIYVPYSSGFTEVQYRRYFWGY